MPKRTRRTKRTTRRPQTGRRSTSRTARRYQPARKKTTTARAAKAVTAARTFTRQTKKTTTEWLAEQTMRTLNDALTSLEAGANYTYRMLQSWEPFSGGDLLKNWKGWATKFNPHDLVQLAQAHKNTWERDLTKFANGVATAIKNTSEELIPNGELLMRDAKRNFSGAYQWVRRSPFMHVAKDVVEAGKNDILSMLNIPSQDEVTELERKLSVLEQRMTTLMLRGSRKR